MDIGTIGYNYSHGSDFVVDRPNGVGCWLMLIIKTPASFVLGEKKYDVRENSFIVISPETPCRYCASGDTYTDDWIYFGADDGVSVILKEFQIRCTYLISCHVHLNGS